MTGNPRINASTPSWVSKYRSMASCMPEGWACAPTHGPLAVRPWQRRRRPSPRNTLVAQTLHERGIATLLFDLLTSQEDRLSAERFDIGLLSHRLLGATRWAQKQAPIGELPLGNFGASTGAAAALIAAATLGEEIRAVVSRGGRPDLALPVLGEVTAPTLLIVGGLDLQVIEMNEVALQHLKGPKALRIIPGATHLFEEPGTLEQAAEAAADWFTRYLPEHPV